MRRFLVLLSTAPSLSQARRLARILLQQRLAACINLIPSCESHYHWKGKRVKSREILLLIKTRARLYPKLERALRKNHSYDIPELISLPVVKGSADYLRWLEKECR